MLKNLASFQSDPTSAGAADAVIPVVQTNLVSDIAGLAIATDPHLVNRLRLAAPSGSRTRAPIRPLSTR
jgi:hypothetical protein